MNLTNLTAVSLKRKQDIGGQRRCHSDTEQSANLKHILVNTYLQLATATPPPTKERIRKVDSSMKMKRVSFTGIDKLEESDSISQVFGVDGQLTDQRTNNIHIQNIITENIKLPDEEKMAGTGNHDDSSHHSILDNEFEPQTPVPVYPEADVTGKSENLNDTINRIVQEIQEINNSDPHIRTSQVQDEEEEKKEASKTTSNSEVKQETPIMKKEEEEENQIQYSLLSKSNNILDSPASKHLMTAFQKFVAKEIITKSRRDTTDQDPGVTITSSKRSLTILPPSSDTPVIKDQSEEVRKEENLETESLKTMVKCCYAHSGCKEMLERWSPNEQEHFQTCKYRPLQCILKTTCCEILPYHDYIPHLMQHFLVPTYSNEIISSVILTPQDFLKDQKWTPKWFSAHDQHFFANISRTTTTIPSTINGQDEYRGKWTAWVCMLGSPEEADNFAARITFYKNSKCVSEVFPVHSIRVSEDTIETERTCLLVTDQTMQQLSLIGDNCFADFSLKVELIPHAKQLNITTRELRARSRPHSKSQKSSKFYVTTIDATELSD